MATHFGFRTVVESPRMCVEINTTAPNGRIGGQRIPVLIAGCTEAAIHTEAYNTSVGYPPTPASTCHDHPTTRPLCTHTDRKI